MTEEGPSGSHYFGRHVPEGAAAPPQPQAEPISRAPWPALLLAASILLLFLFQSTTGSVEAWNERWGLRPSDLFEGRRLETLVTALWCHAGWGHAGANAAFALAFGAAVARLFGVTARGVVLFFAFYLLGGVIASLGFALLHRGDDMVLVGASGAISALTGASARLLRAPQAPGEPFRLAPFTSGPVIAMSVTFTIANLILGLIRVDIGQGGAPLAWEAHIAGFLAGLLMIGPFARLAGARGVPRGD